MKNLYKKLFEVQKKLKPIVKDSDNPFFKSKYADINSILGVLKPLLNETGLVLLQPLSGRELKTIVIDAESGEMIEHSTQVPENADIQKYGAGITYLRRFCINSFFALEAEDDDGNSLNDVKKLYSEASTTTQATSKKVCDRCNSEHTGQYKTCYNCYIKAKNGIPPKQEPLNEVNLEEIPFFPFCLKTSAISSADNS